MKSRLTLVQPTASFARLAWNNKVLRPLLLAAFALAPTWVLAAPSATDTWSGYGVSGGTSGSNWDNLGNYASPTTAFGSTVDLNFSTLNATTPVTLTSTTSGTISADDLYFGVASSTITTMQDINFNGNGTVGGTTLSLSGNIAIPAPAASIVTMGSDLTLSLSNTTHSFEIAPLSTALAETSVPSLVINSQIIGGGAATAIADAYTNQNTLAVVLTNNTSTFDAALSVNDGYFSYTSINNTGAGGGASSVGTAINSSGAITFGNNGRFDYIGSGNQTTNRTVNYGNNQLDNYATSASVLTFNGTITSAATSTTQGTNATLTFGVSTGNTTTVNTVLANSTAANTGSSPYPDPVSITKGTGEAYYNANGALTSGNGNGLLILSGANTYTGTTTVQSGTLQVGNGTTGSLNGSTGTALTFQAGGGTFNVDEASGVSQGMGTLTFSAGDGVVESTNNGGTSDLSFTSLATRTAGATGNFETTNGTNGTTNEITISGVTSGSFMGAGYFFDGGSSNANYAYMSSTGYIRGINYGTDSGSQNDTTGAAFTSGDNVEVSMANVTGQTTQSISTLQIADTSTVGLGSGQTLTLGGILKSGASASSISGGILTTGNATDLVIRVDQASDSLTISSTISGTTTGLTKSGAGTLTLTGTNSWAGATYLDGGTLQVKSLPNGTTLDFNGGNFEWLSGTSTDYGAVVLNASGEIQVDSGTLTLANTVNLENTGVNTLTIGGAGNTTIATTILTGSNAYSGAGGSIVKIGSGTLTLTGASGGAGANTYTGTTSVDAGTLSFNSVGPSANTAQSLGEGSYIYMGVAGTSSGILDYTGAAGTLDKNINVLGSGSDTIENTGTGLLTLSGQITASGTTVNFNGGTNGLAVTGTIGGSASGSNVTTTGGTTTLSGPNTYVGTTTVNSGASLFISNTTGSALGASTVNVARGATFGGAGTGTGLAAFTLGTGSSGTAQVQVGSGGTNTTSVLTLSAVSGTITNANLAYNLSSTTAGQGNQLNLGATALGSTTFSPSTPSTLTLNLVGAGTIANGTEYVLMTDSSGFTSTGLTFAAGGSDAGSSTTDVITGGLTIASNASFGPSGTYAGSYVFLTDNGDQIDLMVAAVPEPSTWMMLAGGLVLLAFWHRRTSRRGGNLFAAGVSEA